MSVFVDNRGVGEEELYEILKDKYKLPVKRVHIDSSDIQFGDVGIERKSVLADTPIFIRENGKCKVLTIKEIYDSFNNGNILEALGFSFINNQSGWFKVYNVIKHKTNKIYRVLFTSKQAKYDKGLGITSGHNVWKLKRGKYKKIISDYLNSGDWLLSVKNISKDKFHVDFNKFLDERKNKMKIKKGYTINNEMFKVNSSKYWEKMPILEKLGFFTGLWVGDGMIIDKQLKISQKIEERNKIIEKELDKLGFKWYWYNEFYILRSTILSEYFESLLDFKTGSENKEVPPFIFDSDKKTKRKFILGYLFADGWVTYRGENYQIKVTSKSKKLIIGLSILLSEFGVQHNTYPVRKGKYFSLCINKTNKFIKEIGQIPTKEVGFIENERDYHWELDYKKKDKPEDLFFKRINRIEKEEGLKEVYDLSVKDSENFIGGLQPILLHNTTADLENSVISDNRHFFDQMKVLKDTYKHPIVIVEGYYSRKDRLVNSILYSLILGWKIPFVNTFNLQDTAEVINGLLRRYGRSNCRDYVPAAVKKAYTPEKVKWMMLMCVVGVGPKKAKEILKEIPDLFKLPYYKEYLIEALDKIKGLRKRSKDLLIEVFS